MKATFAVLFCILLNTLYSCNTDNMSANNVDHSAIDKSNNEDLRVTTNDLSLTGKFIEYQPTPFFKNIYSDSITSFTVSTQIKNWTSDTLTFLNMLCAKESFYSANVPYVRLMSNLCAFEGFDYIEIAPNGTYDQLIFIGFSNKELESELPDLVLSFEFQYTTKRGKLDSLIIYSNPIRIPS